ncbi:MAG: hypothetical protein NDI69_16125 [Bacteriovoracaceae bacterium]|nr:hypothetical protein [Bacteriovoracaceae bacterium]
MKFKAILATTVLFGTLAAQASCFNAYQDQLSEVNTHIKNSNHSQAIKEGIALASTTNVIVISALSGGAGGPLVSTAAGAGLISSLYLASTYIDLRIEDGVEQALAKRSLLESSLSLLRQAKLGNGPLLQEAIVGVNRSVSTSISLKDLADKINEQSAERQYCQNSDQVMSPAGILTTAINELKAEL